MSMRQCRTRTPVHAPEQHRLARRTLSAHAPAAKKARRLRTTLRSPARKAPHHQAHLCMHAGRGMPCHVREPLPAIGSRAVCLARTRVCCHGRPREPLRERLSVMNNVHLRRRPRGRPQPCAYRRVHSAAVLSCASLSVSSCCAMLPTSGSSACTHTSIYYASVCDCAHASTEHVCQAPNAKVRHSMHTSVTLQTRRACTRQRSAYQQSTTCS